MKVITLIKKLLDTDLDNEVRLINTNKKDSDEDCTENIYMSFDDYGDVLLYEE